MAIRMFLTLLSQDFPCQVMIINNIYGTFSTWRRLYSSFYPVNYTTEKEIE